MPTEQERLDGEAAMRCSCVENDIRTMAQCSYHGGRGLLTTVPVPEPRTALHDPVIDRADINEDDLHVRCECGFTAGPFLLDHQAKRAIEAHLLDEWKKFRGR